MVDVSDARQELAGIAASLRAYLEVQQDSGSTGIPRGARRAKAPREAGPAPAVHAPAAVTAPAPAAPPPPAALAAQAAPVVLPEMFPEAAPARAAAPIAPAAPAPPPRSLDVLREAVASCTRCGLAKTRTNTVFSRGNPEAKLCFIGEAPGADEDAQGVPFVGRAGQLLDKMIQAMGLSPDKDVYVCNIIKCRPPGNRRPTPEETSTCIPYLHEQLANVQPKVIVALGNTAVGSLLGTSMGITKMRGQWKLFRGKTLLMPTYHPSYLLRASPQQQQAKREAWEDLQQVMKELGLALPGKK